MTSGRKTVPAACDEDGSNLESDETRPTHHVVIPQRDPFDQREPVAPHHVSEAPDTFVACSPVELDQDLILVLAQIADVSQSVCAAVDLRAAARVDVPRREGTASPAETPHPLPRHPRCRRGVAGARSGCARSEPCAADEVWPS